MRVETDIKDVFKHLQIRTVPTCIDRSKCDGDYTVCVGTAHVAANDSGTRMRVGPVRSPPPPAASLLFRDARYHAPNVTNSATITNDTEQTQRQICTHRKLPQVPERHVHAELPIVHDPKPSKVERVANRPRSEAADKVE